MAMALDATNLDEVAARVRKLIEIAPPGGRWSESFAALLRLAPLANAIPKIVRAGSVQDVVMAQPDLTQLPVLTTWPLDAGPFITLPLVITKDPRTRTVQRRHVSHAGLQCDAKRRCTGSVTSTDARTPMLGAQRFRSRSPSEPSRC